MKNIFTASLLRTTILTILIMINISQSKAQYYPEEEFDTTGIIVDTNTDGMDTVWFYGDNLTDTINTEDFRLGLHDSVINVSLGSIMKPVNKGLYGFNTAVLNP